MSKRDGDVSERVRKLEREIAKLTPPRISGEDLEQAVVIAVKLGEDIFVKPGSGIGWGDDFIDGGTYHVFDKADAVKVGMLTRTGLVTTGELSRQSKRYHELKSLYDERVKPTYTSLLRSDAQVTHAEQVLFEREAALISAREAIKSANDRRDAYRLELEQVLDDITV